MKPKIPTKPVDLARPIIEKFGGKMRMSEITGIKYGTIDGWEKSDVIPEKYRYGLLAIARREGIPHTPWDYVAYLVDLPIAA